MISCARQGKNELIYWGPTEDVSSLQSLQAKVLEDIRPLLTALGATSEERFHIDDISLDGPRVLFTLFNCVGEHNGTVYATGPLCSFWGSLESSSKP